MIGVEVTGGLKKDRSLVNDNWCFKMSFDARGNRIPHFKLNHCCGSSLKKFEDGALNWKIDRYESLDDDRDLRRLTVEPYS